MTQVRICCIIHTLDKKLSQRDSKNRIILGLLEGGWSTQEQRLCVCVCFFFNHCCLVMRFIFENWSWQHPALFNLCFCLPVGHFFRMCSASGINASCVASASLWPHSGLSGLVLSVRWRMSNFFSYLCLKVVHRTSRRGANESLLMQEDVWRHKERFLHDKPRCWIHLFIFSTFEESDNRLPGFMRTTVMHSLMENWG